jgi:hypothetical protein
VEGSGYVDPTPCPSRSSGRLSTLTVRRPLLGPDEKRRRGGRNSHSPFGQPRLRPGARADGWLWGRSRRGSFLRDDPPDVGLQPVSGRISGCSDFVRFPLAAARARRAIRDGSARAHRIEDRIPDDLRASGRSRALPVHRRCDRERKAGSRSHSTPSVLSRCLSFVGRLLDESSGEITVDHLATAERGVL